MTFHEYQIESALTWLAHYNYGQFRAVLGLVGEAGEVAEQYKKVYRGDKRFDNEQIKKELGDVLYYLCRVAEYHDLSLEDIAISNIEKLKDRQKRNVIKGDGDNR